MSVAKLCVDSSITRVFSTVVAPTFRVKLPEFNIISEPSDDQWNQLQQMVEMEKWGPYCPDQIFLIRHFKRQKIAMAVMENGQVLGAITYTVHPDLRQTYLSYYIVNKFFRGVKLASRLWEHVLFHESKALTGRYMAIDTYGIHTREFREKRGFRNENTTTALRIMGLNHLLQDTIAFQLEKWDPVQVQIIPVDPKNLAPLLAYDLSVSRRDRSDFYEIFSKLPSYRGFYAVSPEGHVVGICFVGVANTAIRVGPLYAENMTIALMLLSAGTKEFPLSAQVMLHLPSDNSDFHDFLERKAKFGVIFDIERSYTDPIRPRSDHKKIFSYTAHVGQSDC